MGNEGQPLTLKPAPPMAPNIGPELVRFVSWCLGNQARVMEIPYQGNGTRHARSGSFFLKRHPPVSLKEARNGKEAENGKAASGVGQATPQPTLLGLGQKPTLLGLGTRWLL